MTKRDLFDQYYADLLPNVSLLVAFRAFQLWSEGWTEEARQILVENQQTGDK